MTAGAVPVRVGVEFVVFFLPLIMNHEFWLFFKYLTTRIYFAQLCAIGTDMVLHSFFIANPMFGRSKAK